MVVRNPSSFLSRFKYDLLVLFFLGLVGLGAWLNRHPITFDAENPEAEGTLPPSIGDGEVLLLIAATGAPATSFDELDFTFAWYNTLAQEVGPFRLHEADDLAPEHLEGIELVVVPRRAAVALDAPLIALLGAWVDSGGSLIVEMPGPAWSELSGIDQAVLMGRAAKRFTAANGSLLQGDFGQHLLDTPLETTMMRLDTVDLPDVKRNDVLLEIDGVPAHFHRAHGGGHVYVVGFDFGMAVTALQQGRPEADLTILPPESEEDPEDVELTRPDLLVASPKLRQAAVPYADLLERHVLYAPLRSRPTARLWLFPEAMAGALAMTHDENGFGDRAAYLAEYEGQLGLTSTYFVSPIEMTNAGLDQLGELGVEVGLAWHRAPADPVYEPRGLGRLKPYRAELSLAEQLARLEGWAGRRIPAVRVHKLVWDRSYTGTLRQLAAAGLRIDASYGPALPEDYGYLFGTGLPFYPLDLNGLPLPIYEMPVAVSDAAGFGPADQAVVARMIKESRAGFHQLITVDIDADAMARNPMPSTLDTWMGALALAPSERHWVTNLQEYALFFDQRRHSAIRSSFDPTTRTLVSSLEIPAALSPRDGAPMPAPTVAVPMRVEGSALEAAVLDGRPIELSTLGRSGDGVLALITLPPGSHRLEVRYAKP